MVNQSGTKSQAIVFVHGIGGSKKTWGAFEELLLADPEISSHCDITYYNYPSVFLAIPFLRKAPKIQVLADGLNTFLHASCATYDKVHLICHSLGGVVARQSISKKLKDPHPRKPNVETLTLFAVPCNGAVLASLAQFFSPFNLQVRQICRQSDLLDNLNEAWHADRVEEKVLVKYVVGGLDDVVSPESARSHYGNRSVETIVHGTHKSLVKPTSVNDQAFIIVKQALASGMNAVAQGPVTVDVSKYLDTANAAYADGDFEFAEKTLEAALHLGAPTGLLVRELGKVYFARRAFDKVQGLIADWNNAGRPEDVDISCMRAELLIRNAMLEPAIEILSRAAPRDTYNLEYLTGSAYFLSSLDNPLNLIFASKHLRAATQIDPESWWARVNLVCVLKILALRNPQSAQSAGASLSEQRASAERSIERELERHPFIFSARLYRLALAAVFDDKASFTKWAAEDIAFFGARRLPVTYIFPKSWIARLKLLYAHDASTLSYYENGLYNWLHSI